MSDGTYSNVHPTESLLRRSMGILFFSLDINEGELDREIDRKSR